MGVHILPNIGLKDDGHFTINNYLRVTYVMGITVSGLKEGRIGEVKPRGTNPSFALQPHCGMYIIQMSQKKQWDESESHMDISEQMVPRISQGELLSECFTF